MKTDETQDGESLNRNLRCSGERFKKSDTYKSQNNPVTELLFGSVSSTSVIFLFFFLTMNVMPGARILRIWNIKNESTSVSSLLFNPKTIKTMPTPRCTYQVGNTKSLTHWRLLQRRKAPGGDYPSQNATRCSTPPVGRGGRGWERAGQRTVPIRSSTDWRRDELLPEMECCTSKKERKKHDYYLWGILMKGGERWQQ